MSKNEAKLAGIIGWPIGHSLSPTLYTYWLKEYGINGGYIPLSIRAEDFANCVAGLAQAGFVGVNVTVPHKEAAFALANEPDEGALATGAVNTLVFGREKVIGLNTDVQGFTLSLEESLGRNAAAAGPVVVLGAGGAARAVVIALTRARAPEIRLLNRTRKRAEMLAANLKSVAIRVIDWGQWQQAFSGARLLVNATVLGMKGALTLDISLDNLAPEAGVADIVYNPLTTNLLASARSRGHKTMDGLGMLMHQAAPAFAAWYGVRPQVTPELRAMLERALLLG
jgi:shikimate dehydrogenase